ncbi:MAG: hypothetical protein OXC95_17350 [Dehalococcoidia bacterium]|nr:hypothetical protein [Dehalococcoidia bacterium]
MLPSTTYYIVTDNRLEAVSNEMTDLIEAIEDIAEPMPGDELCAQVYSRHLTTQKPGPFEPEDIARLGENGIELIETSDPEDGQTHYLVPHQGSLTSASRLAGIDDPADIERFHREAAEVFEPRQQTPAQVRYILIDEDLLSPDEEMPEQFVASISARMKESQSRQLTILQWTE